MILKREISAVPGAVSESRGPGPWISCRNGERARVSRLRCRTGRDAHSASRPCGCRRGRDSWRRRSSGIPPMTERLAQVWRNPWKLIEGSMLARLQAAFMRRVCPFRRQLPPMIVLAALAARA